ncbi:MAG: hypothetical protein K6D61_04800 [Prevotella sp.]|nr:hypothetical protein [Prevotella sp.]
MELEALKASWNKLDERLAETEIVNLRMVKEMIQQKTKSAFDHIMGQNIYSFVVNMLIICVVFPFVYLNTPIQTSSFAIVEGVMVIGLIPMVWKLSLLSRFDLGGKSSSELSRLVLTYKKVCHQEKIWMIGAVCLAMIAFYILELGFNTEAGYEFSTRLLLPLGLSLLTFGLGLVFAKWQLRRHAHQLQEIERGLQELREFEK